MKDGIIEYRDKKKQWRWRAVRSGRVIADSGEGYVRRIDMRRALASVEKMIFAWIMKRAAKAIVDEIGQKK